MRSQTDKTLKAVIDFLHEKAAKGTMEQGRTKALREAIRKLRKAHHTGNRREIAMAITLVAKVFLRNADDILRGES